MPEMAAERNIIQKGVLDAETEKVCFHPRSDSWALQFGRELGK